MTAENQNMGSTSGYLQYRKSRTIFSRRLHLIPFLHKTYWAAAQVWKKKLWHHYLCVRVLEMGNSPDALSPIYQNWNPCQLLKKPDWTEALSNLVLPFISINYNHVAFAGFIFINISSNNQPKKTPHQCLHTWVSFHRLKDISEACLKIGMIDSPHTQHSGQKSVGPMIHTDWGERDFMCGLMILCQTMFHAQLYSASTLTPDQRPRGTTTWEQPVSAKPNGVGANFLPAPLNFGLLLSG